MRERRICAYGGTFDPIHNGHLEVARAVVKNFDLDELLIVPAWVPPHKRRDSISEAYHRYTMAVLASLAEPAIKVSMMEIEAPERPYTYETVERLLELYGSHTDLFFVMGADSFEEIGTWREPQRILSGTKLIVTSRPGYELRNNEAIRADIVMDLRGQVAAHRSQLGGYRVFLTDCVQADVSSTEIRRRVRQGEPISQFVPQQVAEYITRYGLYKREPNGSQGKERDAR